MVNVYINIKSKILPKVNTFNILFPDVQRQQRDAGACQQIFNALYQCRSYPRPPQIIPDRNGDDIAFVVSNRRNNICCDSLSYFVDEEKFRAFSMELIENLG